MIGKERYYQKAKEASTKIGNHPGLIILRQLVSISKKVLDVGCGEGTRLNLFSKKGHKGTGVDVSGYAIKKAKKQYSHFNFVLVKGEKLPFQSNSFDLAYSTFVLEHTQDPKLFVDEMIRIVRPNGKIVILCPNYGAPNRRSPVSKANPLKKLLFGVTQDIIPKHNTSLSFTKVTPRKIFRNSDDDTTCEPYLLTLQRYLIKEQNIQIEISSSLWEIDDQVHSHHQRIFKFLGTYKIPPFKFWGPQLFVVLRKI